MQPMAFHNLPADHYPLIIEALHPSNNDVLWSQSVPAPMAIRIPPLAKKFGHRIKIRVRFGNGTQVEEDGIKIGDDGQHKIGNKE